MMSGWTYGTEYPLVWSVQHTVHALKTAPAASFAAFMLWVLIKVRVEWQHAFLWLRGQQKVQMVLAVGRQYALLRNGLRFDQFKVIGQAQLLKVVH